MKLDLSCPIELRGYTLTCTDGTVEASVRLYNLTNRRIASFEAIAKWRSSTSGRSTAMPFNAERLRAGGENGFRITLSCSRLPDADELDVVFTAVRFEDGCDDWRAGEGMIVEINPLEPISSADLSALRTAAGEDAVCFPAESAGTWRCVCGRVNPDESDNCVRCHRSRANALGCTPENVRRYNDALRPAYTESETEIAALQAGFFRQRARLLRRTLAMAIAALALTAMLVLSHQPAESVNASAEVVGVYSSNTTAQEE